MPQTSDDAATARHHAQHHDSRPERLLEMLHDIQEDVGCISDAAVAELASALNLSRADVHGVVTFYHDFRSTPAGCTRLQICRAEACQAMGCEALVAHAEKLLDIRCGDTTADGAFTLSGVYCLGNCALAPAAMLQGDLVGRLDTARLEHIIHTGREAQP